MLEISGLDFRYVNVHALKNISIKVDEKAIVSVIGKRNSGKSTLFKIIAGLKDPDAGDVFYAKKSILKKDRYKNLNGEVICIERDHGLFLGLTVKENIELGAWQVNDRLILRNRLDMMLEFIPYLEKSFNVPAFKLHAGEQMLTLIARAIFAKPKLIIIDEPTFGLYQLFADKVLELIHRVNIDLEIAFLLMQQNAIEAVKIADWIYELENGEIIKQGDKKAFEYFDCIDI